MMKAGGLKAVRKLRGIAAPETNSSQMLFGKLKQTADTAISIFPVMKTATIVRSWSGIEGRIPDDMPVIGRSSTEENVFQAFGFSAHGFQMGPGVGELMAELTATGETNAPIEPFNISRFTTKQ